MEIGRTRAPRLISVTTSPSWTRWRSASRIALRPVPNACASVVSGSCSSGLMRPARIAARSSCSTWSVVERRSTVPNPQGDLSATLSTTYSRLSAVSTSREKDKGPLRLIGDDRSHARVVEGEAEQPAIVHRPHPQPEPARGGPGEQGGPGQADMRGDEGGAGDPDPLLQVPVAAWGEDEARVRLGGVAFDLVQHLLVERGHHILAGVEVAQDDVHGVVDVAVLLELDVDEDPAGGPFQSVRQQRRLTDLHPRLELLVIQAIHRAQADPGVVDEHDLPVGRPPDIDLDGVAADGDRVL